MSEWFFSSAIVKQIGITLLGAIVGGVISFSPWLLDRIGASGAEITYRVVDGPAIPFDGKYKRTLIYNIKNSGGKLVNGLVIEVNIKDSSIDHAASYGDFGLIFNQVKGSDSYRVSVDYINVDEQFNIAISYTSLHESGGANLNARSPGVLIKRYNEEKSERKPWFSIVLGLFIASMFPMIFRARRIINGEEGVFGKGIIYSPKRSCNVRYILLKLGFNDIARNMNKYRLRTYYEMADYLLCVAESESNAAYRAKITYALKAMICCQMNERSKDLIIRHLMKIEGEKYDAEYISKIRLTQIGLNICAIRDAIDVVIDRLHEGEVSLTL